MKRLKDKKIIITYGTYDMFHIGHMRLLERAKALGDYLIVGVTSEIYDRSRGKLNVSQSEKKRMKAIEALDFVDEVILETHKGQKAEDMQKYGVDIFAIGDDWVGAFDYLNEYTHVEYLARTKGISSTELREEHFPPTKVGIVGLSSNTQSFIEESKHVTNIKVSRIYTKDYKALKKLTKNYKIKYNHDTYKEFLNTSIKAIYIDASTKQHYDLISKALKAGKHVLCQNDITLTKFQLKELLALSKKKKKILLIGAKTLFLPSFKDLHYDIEGCGYRYMIAEFGSLIQRRKYKSKILTAKNMIENNKKNRKK